MSKGGGSQTVTSTPDAATQSYVQQMRQLALGYAGIGSGTGAMGGLGPSGQGVDPNTIAALRAKGGIWSDLADKMQASGVRALGGTQVPLPPSITQAQQQYGQYANAGQQGLAALTGNAGAQAQFMSPYLSTLDPFFAQQRQQAVEGANQQATLAGAFGGDRSQIGAAVAGNQADQTQAGFTYQAFLDAMNRAQSAAGLGLGAIGAGAFLPQQYASGQLGLLQQALGPYGTTQSQQMHGDPLSQLLGIGTTVGGFLLGGPAGAAAGSAYQFDPSQIGRTFG